MIQMQVLIISLITSILISHLKAFKKTTHHMRLLNNMAKLIERRKFRRFEIPGSRVKIMPGLGSSLIRPFLKQYPLLNMGMGGINFISTREFIKGEELVIELNAPEVGQMELLLRVIWTSPVPLSKDLVTGCEFFQFGEERQMNSPDSMNTLRRLYARHIKD